MLAVIKGTIVDYKKKKTVSFLGMFLTSHHDLVFDPKLNH